MWSYYNFKANWDRFFAVWQTDIIQTILQDKIEEWLHERNICYVWQKNEPLWFLTESNYWDERASYLANNHIISQNVTKHFKTSFNHATGYVFKNNDEARSLMNKLVTPHIQSDFYPKDNTLESLVLLGGKNYVSNALYRVCIELFPNDRVIYTLDNQMNDAILLPDQKMVFDLEGYVLSEIEKNPFFDISNASDYYDLLVYEYYSGRLFQDSEDSYS